MQDKIKQIRDYLSHFQMTKAMSHFLSLCDELEDNEICRQIRVVHANYKQIKKEELIEGHQNYSRMISACLEILDEIQESETKFSLTSKEENFSKLFFELLEGEKDKLTDYYMTFLEYIDNKPKAVGEAKVIFVGSGGVGKTSLVNLLAGGRFNPYLPQTDGIEVKYLEMPYEGKHIKNVKLNVWDFGGQEIFYATHQLFFTGRSIYVIVADARIEDSPRYSALRYWLETVYRHTPESPVVLVMNKRDVHFFQAPFEELQAEYPQVVGYVWTSCKEYIGIQELKNLIKKSLNALPQIDTLLPSTYFKIKEKLEQNNQDYLEAHQFIEICKTVDEKITKDGWNVLRSLLHDLGVMYSLDVLDDFYVLNPEWMTKGVYSILSSPQLIEKKGMLEEQGIRDILDRKDYPTKQEVDFLMEILKQSEICYQVETNFIFPSAFSLKKQASLSITSKDESLVVHYQYQILREIIIVRLIVRLHTLIDNENYWKNGFKIVQEDAETLVTANYVDNLIEIEVVGNKRKELLKQVRQAIEFINATFLGMSCEMMVPLTKEKQDWVSLETLKRLQEHGKKSITSYSNAEEININELLSNFE